MKLVEIFLGVAFMAIIFGTSGVVLFALVADALGWYDDVTGKYIGPFSSARREKD